MENLHLVWLENKELELQNELNMIRGWIKNEREKINQYLPINLTNSQTQTPNSSEKTGIIKKTSSINEKFLWALKNQQKFLNVRQIAILISGITGENERDLAESLSKKTQKLQILKKIVRFSPNGPESRKNVYWGALGWLDDDNSIKKGFEYVEFVGESTYSILDYKI